MLQYSQEQLWKLFEKLPDDLKDAILSEDTANTIREICQRNEIGEEDMPKLAKMVGDVLMGLLPPEEFTETLEKELKADKEQAKRISREVNRFILFPVKNSLEEFYKEIRFAPGGRLVKQEVKKEASEKEKPGLKEKPKLKEKKPVGADIYREPIK